MEKKTAKGKLKDKEIELILARLDVLPPRVFFSSGNDGTTISRDQMIEHVKRGDSIGQEFVKTELEFLRAIKDGKLLKQIISPQTELSI
jgi:hypothetical protein